MDYGPTIAAAFASPNEREIFQLRTIFSEMLKRSPQDTNMKMLIGSGTGRAPGQSDGQNTGRNAYLSSRYDGHGPPLYSYSSSASTSMLFEQASATSRSGRSGILSTGPVERRRDPEGEAVAGYTPTTRSTFHY